MRTNNLVRQITRVKRVDRNQGNTRKRDRYSGTHYYGHPWDWAKVTLIEVTIVQGADVLFFAQRIQFGTEQG